MLTLKGFLHPPGYLRLHTHSKLTALAQGGDRRGGAAAAGPRGLSSVAQDSQQEQEPGQEQGLKLMCRVTSCNFEGSFPKPDRAQNEKQGILLRVTEEICSLLFNHAQSRTWISNSNHTQQSNSR